MYRRIGQNAQNWNDSSEKSCLSSEKKVLVCRVLKKKVRDLTKKCEIPEKQNGLFGPRLLRCGEIFGFESFDKDNPWKHEAVLVQQQEMESMMYVPNRKHGQRDCGKEGESIRRSSERVSARATNMVWGTAFPLSRMSASKEYSIKLFV
jgi:hypothetical protein